MAISLFRNLILVVVLSLAASPTVHAAGAADPVAYATALRKAGGVTSTRVEIHCAYVLALAEKSRAELDDSFFPGIKEKLQTAASEVLALRAAKGEADPEFIRLKALLVDTTTQVQGHVDYIKAHKLDGVSMPANAYTGADASSLRTAVGNAWKARYPEDQVLAIRFPQAAWKRDVTEEWVGDTKKRYDISSLVVKVVTVKDADVATIHGIILQVDHHESETLKIGKKDVGFAPSDMWRKNVTPG